MGNKEHHFGLEREQIGKNDKLISWSSSKNCVLPPLCLHVVARPAPKHPVTPRRFPVFEKVSESRYSRESAVDLQLIWYGRVVPIVLLPIGKDAIPNSASFIKNIHETQGHNILEVL